MDKARHYWKSLEERDGAEQSADEFPEPLTSPTVQFDRRSFLRATGLGVATAALAGCSRAPVEKVIPLLVQPEEAIPGKSYFYATTCGGCSAGCGALAKVRDGRPVKLEGNPEHTVSRGGLCAIGQASLYELYDSSRLRTPRLHGKETTWDELDRSVVSGLANLQGPGGAVRLLSTTVTSPTLQAMFAKFLAQFGDARLVTYDALSCSAILDAHDQTHGVRALPHYRFDSAEVIVSFDADFLGTWISPVEYTAGWRAGRDPDADPPRSPYHIQFESHFSLTGSKADQRVALAPDQLATAVGQLAARVARRAGTSFPGEIVDQPVRGTLLDELAERLWQARGRGLVVSGSQDVVVQIAINFTNRLLGNYGSTLDIERPSQQRQGNDHELALLLRELQAGRVGTLFLHGVNPAAELPAGKEWAAALERVPLVVSFSNRLDESARLAHIIAPDCHFLESWGDAEPLPGKVSVFQPVLHALGQPRPVLESLSLWMGQPQSAHEILRSHWQSKVFPRQKGERSFEAFWDRSVHDGAAEIEPETTRPSKFRAGNVRPLKARPAGNGTFTLVLYPTVPLGDGRHAHNAQLQELPDPITKVVWDNYASISPQAAAQLGVKQGDVVRLQAAERNESLELPVYVQPGQADSVVAVALGYGRVETERFAQIGPRWWLARPSVDANGRVGQNASGFLGVKDRTLQYTQPGVQLVQTGRKRALACTQSHHSVTAPKNLPVVGGQSRPIVQEMTLASLLAENPEREQKPQEDLYPPDHTYPVHHWAMVVDTTACTGCSACVISCQAENNIPVVGKDEVLRQREMHWLRIDRYYTGSEEMRVVHQPMMCQQCDYAPCETVCPVLATVHSDEGLNQQIYNRCVGTRYCANNCPYKTRRFNWFNYPREDRLLNLALNPDVTVRSRGVMEKCTFCVQRIQEAKIEAKRRGEPLVDGAIQPACQQSCPANAIVFGDLNDRSSRVSNLISSRRRYQVLAEFNFRPSVSYLAAVRNSDDIEEPKRHG